ncbi:hypothetical protein BELL_0473g00090 [Botrytis elliptica]|uniref:Uncharacterized protein n=1 Tax=Botrytis elliptica TaxID=278938 RepID=A0A4Z1JER8_9HELO|nr:hypothetical protein EAE99_002173 [Botrytis elliptica]TGO72271.1 hypothetical protein BELL_0473g00090 [Botrytis elliptica]
MTSAPLSECVVYRCSSSWAQIVNVVCMVIFLILKLSTLIMGAIAYYKDIMEQRQIFPPPNPNDTEEGRDARRRIWERIEKRDYARLRDYESLAIQVEYCAKDVDKDDVYHIDLVEQARALNYTIKSIRNEIKTRYKSKDLEYMN